MTARLPLFPLGSVLFPGLVLPLNIFEERYRALARDLLALPEDAPRHFGVVAIRDGYEVAPSGPGAPDDGAAAGLGPDLGKALYEVGCIADAASLREKEGGGYEMVATGTTRFRLRSVDATGPYLVAEIEELPELPGAGAGPLTAEVERAFRTYQKQLAGARERTLSTAQELPAQPSVLSYLVAAATVVEVPVKQELLEAADTATRLTEELKLLRRETAVIGKLPSLPAVELTRQPTNRN
ncbi:LON peptidase substrate-binding domain-containing protein [Streptantibioticus ferralitis]|uniref:LON peptidase substrate-binding domain-containing protein n=1 Tax=Streptantibioticus ferralitis TaxID=236510 RepID=A0ABT5Z1W3_9ACTN|nr:LON peptidase substrate-binding domain-containing protein [Streptantibioticus ferralitis]MDF2257040.1 LON peptidase substrate-binding domain-containing protein [Streptantibioticus ferralitis]